MPLRTGENFWRKWRGQERVWQRRPRFDNDVNVLGGFPTIPAAETPRPPTPPQRRDPTTAQRSSQRRLNPAELCGHTPPAREATPASWGYTAAAILIVLGEHQPRQSVPTNIRSLTTQRPWKTDLPNYHRSRKHKPPRRDGRTVEQQPKLLQARLSRPKPPTTSSGSETETSWPSKDPPPQDVDGSTLLQSPGPRASPGGKRTTSPDTTTTTTTATSAATTTTAEATVGSPGSYVPHAKRGGALLECWCAFATRCKQQRNKICSTNLTLYPLQPANNDKQWFSVAANFEGEVTVSGLLRLLQKILHEMLQQSFSLPNEYLTPATTSPSSRAPMSSNYDHQAAIGGKPRPSRCVPGPTAMIFCITNAFVEAEATLQSLAQHHHEPTRRHLVKELRRAEALLQDGRAIFKSWSRDPNAPGALPGTAASQNALDGVNFSFLALEEGGVANLDESLRAAWAAAQTMQQVHG